MGLDKKAWFERVLGGIGLHLRPVDVEFLPPDQPWRLSLLHNWLKEAAKDVNPIALTDTRQTGMVGKRLAEVIAKVPHHAQSIRRMAHQEPLRAYPFKKHHQLQFEEHDRVDGGATATSIGLLHEFPHNREVKCPLKVTVEMILRYQFFQ